MADFEELKLTVNLVDNASAGLGNIRTQLTQLTQTAGQTQTALGNVAAGTQQVGKAAGDAAPKVSSQEKALKELSRSAEETSRGLLQMALAARRGAEAFPELALATREAWTGLKGVNAGMVELGAASRLMVVGLGAVAVGIGAVGAAVVAYGVSVFKFSKEMYQLGQTAKALGMAFGTVKAITEQNERFGISVDTTTAGLARMQETMADLSVSGSQLRQQMIGMGVPPQRIDEIVHETDVIKRRNMVIRDQLIIEQDLKKRMGPEAAAEWANRYGNWFGVDPGARTRPLQKPLTEEEKKRADEIATQSKLIAEQWAITKKKTSDIKEDFKAWGLPFVLDAVKNINSVFNTIAASVKYITETWGKTFGAVNRGIQSGATQFNKFMGIDPSQLTDDELRAKGVEPVHPRTEEQNRAIQENRANPSSRFDRYQPSSFRGDSNPLLHRASFGGDESSDRAQGIIKGGVYDALVQFAAGGQTGRTGGVGGGNVIRASFGGSAGAARGGGVGGFHSGGGFNVLDSSRVGDGGGDGGAPHGSHVGAGAGDGAGETPAGAPGGGGDTSKVGNAFLASQRKRLADEFRNNPELKLRAAAITSLENEGAGPAVIESAANRSVMTGRSMASILSGGPRSFYGPARHPGMVEARMEAIRRNPKWHARLDALTDDVMAGSNVTKGHTDQGSAGDPNYVKGGVGVNIHGERFNDWGGYKGIEYSRRFREEQQAQVHRSAAEAAAAAADTDKSRAAGYPSSLLSMRDSQRRPLGLGLDNIDRPALDRRALSRPQEISSTAKFEADFKNVPRGAQLSLKGTNLLVPTSMQRQTQMMPTDVGPSVGETARSFMRGGTGG